MADNVPITAGSGTNIASRAVTYSADAVQAQAVGLLAFAGADDAKTVIDIPGDAVKGLAVDVTRLPWGTYDTFGKLQTVNSLNDIDVQFFRDVPANLVTVTSATGGTAVTSTGLMQLATSTGTTGAAKAVTLDLVQYRAGGEVYALFTAAWLSGGVATSSQRIGLYDDNNGFFMGYEATAFGVTVRQNAVDGTQTAKASFNVDTLVGAAGSKYTRAGVPEAIDLTKLNLFRIRFGWLGAAPVKFEVASPDGEWVLFHIIRQPNSSATPHIYNPDLPITAHLVKTAGATNIQFNTACWGAGSTYDKTNAYGSDTLGTVVGNTVTYSCKDLRTLRLRCATTTTGTIIFETTVNGTDWITHPQVIKAGANQDLWIGAAETPTAGNSYIVNMTGFRGFRARTASTLGATVVLHYTAEDAVVMQKSLDVAPAPHNFGYSQISKTVTASTAQTGTTIWTPASGKRIVITSIQIQSFGTTAGTAQVWFGASADTSYTRGTDYAIFDGEFAPSATNKPGLAQSGVWMSPTVDYYLKYTTTNAQSINITVWGYEA